MSLLTYCL
jgi:V-type H+-transporting ATPase proteolipid subunit